jgi:hypothetical protein
MDIGCRPSQLQETKAVKQVTEDTGNSTFLFCQDQLPQQKATENDLTTIAEWKLDPKRFSNWVRLVRLQARVRRVVHNLRNPDEVQNSKELLPEEIRDSEEDIIRKAQKEAFPEEYDALTKGKPISDSSLSKLNPRLDEQSVIRSDSRLRYTEYLPYDVRSISGDIAKRTLGNDVNCKILSRVVKPHCWYQFCLIPD